MTPVLALVDVFASRAVLVGMKSGRKGLDAFIVSGADASVRYPEERVPSLDLGTELLVMLSWLFLVFAGWREQACALAGIQAGFAIARWRRRSRFEAARIATLKKLDEEEKRREERVKELVEHRAELERCAPTREAVCHLDDQVLLSCGHVISTVGVPDYLKKAMRVSACCVACGFDLEQKEKRTA
jgi:hypothetical protein